MVRISYWIITIALLVLGILYTANMAINWWLLMPVVILGGVISIVKSFKDEAYIKRTLAIPATNRLPVYDYIRCVAVVLVVVFHTLNWDLNQAGELSGTGLYSGLDSLRWWTLICNMLFIMISGALLLSYKKESLPGFYLKRVVRIAIPLVVYFIWYLWQYDMLKDLSPVDVFIRIFTADVESSNVNHFWIIYQMLFIYLLVPFLRELLSKLSYRSLSYLMIVIAGFSLAGTVTGFFEHTLLNLIGFVLMAIAGYYITREESRSYDMVLIVLGIIASVFMFLIDSDFPCFEGIMHNLSIIRFLICLGVFALFIRLKDILKENYIIRVISKYSYSIMLIHMWVLYFLTRKIIPISSVMYHGLGLLVSVATTMILSVVAAYLIDNLLLIIPMSLLDICYHPHKRS